MHKSRTNGPVKLHEHILVATFFHLIYEKKNHDAEI
jgi:hypothetical protein